jgi:hypothetical protein
VRADEGDFYQREIPRISRTVLWVALLVVVAGLGVWESSMRSLGLTTEDLGEGPSHWAVERRKVDAGEAEVAIIGASRILFDTDLDVFEEVTGLRPVQLALAGTTAGPFLSDLADDPDFDGLLIIGMTELVYFLPPEIGLYEAALHHYRTESPSDWIGHKLYVALSRWLAFIEPDYGLARLVSRLPMPSRAGTFSPYDEVWKIWITEGDRQTRLWQRIESPGHLNEHAKHAWVADWEHNKPTYVENYTAERVAETIAATVTDVEKIRARGGDVVFIRCPSSHFYQDIEREYLPRARIYDRLIAKTQTLGLHFEDYESMQGLDLPEWSHLSAAEAKNFTRAYAEELVRQSTWLRQRMAREDL